MAKTYSRSARVPGFRPGKVPAGVVRQRYKEQILGDVAQDLIPRLVGDALRERGLEPVAAPDIKDVVLEEGRPLTFVADFETLPPIDPGEYTGLPLRRPPAVLEVGAVDRTLDQLRERARPVAAGRGSARRSGRYAAAGPDAHAPGAADCAAGRGVRRSAAGDGEPESLENVTVEIGASVNPPGFDDHLTGTVGGETPGSSR